MLLVHHWLIKEKEQKSVFNQLGSTQGLSEDTESYTHEQRTAKTGVLK